MEAVAVAKKIEDKIEELELLKKELPGALYQQAKTAAEYDKALALTIVRLRNGAEMKLDNHIIKDPPTTIIERIAKGICYKEALDMDTAEGKVKGLVSDLNTAMAQLTGLQSINKHLSDL